MNFTTFFKYGLRNVHLVKDVGVIPALLARNHGYSSRLVSFPLERRFSHLEGEARGLELDLFDHAPGRLDAVARLKFLSYLTRKARSIDVLNLYFLGADTYAPALLYKKLNPSGFLYVKLDSTEPRFARAVSRCREGEGLLSRGGKALSRKFFSKVDLISGETRGLCRLVGETFPSLRDRVHYVPGGIDCAAASALVSRPRTLREKDDLVLVVGRIGLEFKNHGLLLEAISRVDLGNWKVAFVGPVEEPFRAVIEGFFSAHPSLRDRVRFVGEVADRAELYDWYDRARVFCLPSKATEAEVESFGIVLPEALYFENDLLVSDGVPSAEDVTDGGRFGTVLPAEDPEAWARGLAARLAKPASEEIREGERRALVEERFDWCRIVAGIAERLHPDVPQFAG